MASVNVYLGLGSNQGDRLQNLMRALELLDQGFGRPYEALSRIVETEAWGFEGDSFLNACVRYRIGRKGSPDKHGHEILALCKAVEGALGRTDAPEFDAEGRRVYHDRAIDIDLLFYGKERIDCEDLQVPHPLIAMRDFVKIPLAEIAKPSLKAAFPDLFA
jgi:2-amino-4-hydroxy-6-hydroxymethyldihydropteridine diphosphokinase